MKTENMVVVLGIVCCIMLAGPFAVTSKADSTGQYSVVAQTDFGSIFKAGNTANRESTERTVFFLYNHGKTSLAWGGRWFLNHDYSWGKSVNDVIKPFNEIIAMVISGLVFFVEFWFNVLVYYAVGALVMIYGAVVCLVGIVLIPLIAVWNFFLWIVSLL